MKRFVCRDIIPGCAHVFTGADDQSVLDQVIAHAAEDHGLVKPPLALVELVVATTENFTPARGRGHLRLVGTTASGGSVATEGATERGPESTPHAGGVPTAVIDATATDRPGIYPLGINPLGINPVVTDAAARFTRGRASAQPAEPEPAAATYQHDSYRHECHFYRGAVSFVAAVLPFIRDGLNRDQPVMVAVSEPRLQVLRDALGQDAGRVELTDMAVLGRNPARIIPAWLDFLARCGGRQVRGVGEPIWAGRRAAELVECQFHEALLNVAVPAETPLWLLCPYDVDALDEDVITEARRSHPHVMKSGAVPDGHRYGGVEHPASIVAAGLTEPDGPMEHIAFDPGGAGRFTAELLGYAAAAGLPADRSTKFAAAVDEIALAGFRDSGSGPTVRLWQDPAALVCEIADRGVLDDPMVGRSLTIGAANREREIRLANELCDLVQVRSNRAGTTIRLHGRR